MAWWVSIEPEVVSGVESFEFRDSSSDTILEFVNHYLTHYGDIHRADRWDKSPDNFFIYSHLFIEGGRFHTLEFVVDDTSALVGVLRVVWVEHYPGSVL